MRKLFQNLDARDVHFYLGVAMVASGLYFVYAPLALIVPGVVFLYVALRRV